jgi:hypothetical protein
MLSVAGFVKSQQSRNVMIVALTVSLTTVKILNATNSTGDAEVLHEALPFVSCFNVLPCCICIFVSPHMIGSRRCIYSLHRRVVVLNF